MHAASLTANTGTMSRAISPQICEVDGFVSGSMVKVNLIKPYSSTKEARPSTLTNETCVKKKLYCACEHCGGYHGNLAITFIVNFKFSTGLHPSLPLLG